MCSFGYGESGNIIALNFCAFNGVFKLDLSRSDGSAQNAV